MAKIKLILSKFYFFRRHAMAICLATLVGLIYLTPHLFFIASLGDKYQGIPMMQTANEDLYLSRVHEVLDGYPMVNSPALWEYKNEPTLLPPVGEMSYALPSLLFNISLVNVLTAYRFILPFILFLLIYFLIHKLTVNSALLSNKINAVAGALLVTLGYDLIDYRTLWLLLTGEIEGGGYFLMWSRPVHPVVGGVFLFFFLLCLSLIVKQGKYKKILVTTSGVFLALMIGSYFFSWGIAISVIGLLIIIYLIEKRYRIVKSLIAILLLAAILTSPYWYSSWQLSKSPWYEDAMLRNGLFYTHRPLLNKVLLATLALYGIILIILFFQRNIWPLWKQRVIKSAHKTKLQDWHLFCLSLLLGGFWALNQQVVTGMTIWPFHFVQYTIPIAMIVVCVLFYNIIKEKTQTLWALMIIITIGSSLTFGIFTQVKAYQSHFDYYAELQSYKPVFDWLNSQEKDCVVLTIDESGGIYDIGGLVPAYTHCNVYASTWAYTLMQPTRLYDSYLITLRIRGVSADNIKEYLEENDRGVGVYLLSNWKGQFDIEEFPDVSDQVLEDRLKKLPEDYRQFMANDFRTELEKYRLDYILTVGLLSDAAAEQLPELEVVYQSGDISIYTFAN